MLRLMCNRQSLDQFLFTEASCCKLCLVEVTPWFVRMCMYVMLVAPPECQQVTDMTGMSRHACCSECTASLKVRDAVHAEVYFLPSIVIH